MAKNYKSRKDSVVQLKYEDLPEMMSTIQAAQVIQSEIGFAPDGFPLQNSPVRASTESIKMT